MRKGFSAKAGCAITGVLVVLIFSVVPVTFRDGTDIVEIFNVFIALVIVAIACIPIGSLIDKNRQ